MEISSGTSSEESDMSSERNVGWDFGISDLDWEDERIWGCCCCSYECMQIFQLAGYETKTNLKSSSCLQHIPCLMFSLQLFWVSRILCSGKIQTVAWLAQKAQRMVLSQPSAFSIPSGDTSRFCRRSTAENSCLHYYAVRLVVRAVLSDRFAGVTMLLGTSVFLLPSVVTKRQSRSRSYSVSVVGRSVRSASI